MLYLVKFQSLSEFWGNWFVRNRSKLDQQGFQEVRTGRGSVLTEYEPVGPHGGPIHEGVCSESGYSLFLTIMYSEFFYTWLACGSTSS